jgi:hypothetical protein
MLLKVVLFHHSFSFRAMYGLHLQDGNCLEYADHPVLKMEAICSSEMLINI